MAAVQKAHTHTRVHTHALGDVGANVTEPDVHGTGGQGADTKLEWFQEPDLWGLEGIPSRGVWTVFSGHWGITVRGARSSVEAPGKPRQVRDVGSWAGHFPSLD